MPDSYAAKRNTELSKGIYTPHVPMLIYKFCIPVMLCVFWFVISPFIFSSSMIKLGEMLRLGLLLFLGLMILVKRRPIPKFGLIGLMLLIGIPLDMLNGLAPGNLSFGAWYNYFRPMFWTANYALQNVGTLILICLYIDSYSRLINFLKVSALFITLTISVAGIYQLYTGAPIGDWLPLERVFLNRGRLCGLITPCANDAATGILVAVGLLFSRIFGKLTIAGVLLLAINTIALLFTATRGAFLALFCILLVGVPLFPKTAKGKKILKILALCAVGIFVARFFFSVNVSHMIESRDYTRFSDLGTSLDRIWVYRTLIGVSVETVVGAGFGADLSSILAQRGSMYITPHNFFFDWVLRFGVIFAIFFLILVFLQMIRMFKYLKTTLQDENRSTDQVQIAVGLLLAYVGVIVNTTFTGDRFMYIPLLYALCSAFLRYRPRSSVSDQAG